MDRIPSDGRFDSTLDLLREGYAFVTRRCGRLGTDAFRTRLMLAEAVCMSGEEAARVFYQPGRFTRRGAMPQTALRLLQDKGSVFTLDGEAHRARKAMLMSLMTPASIGRLGDLMEAEWRARFSAPDGEVILLEEVRGILCRAAGEWAGVGLTEAEARRRTREFGAMIDGAGSVGPRALRGLALRRRTERWARQRVEEARSELRARPGSALEVIASDPALDAAEAAVELINVLRPTVAVARFIVFAALALYRHPGWRERLPSADDAELERFVQEVRRFYPFFPFVGGRVLEPFEWRGHRFERGAWVLLDLYGTLHDPRLWESPREFRPERFEGRPPGAFDLIAQGGGDYEANHRCAGERLTIELMKRAVRLLARMRYTVPPQDLRIDLSRIPAQPSSGFVIAGAALA